MRSIYQKTNCHFSVRLTIELRFFEVYSNANQDEKNDKLNKLIFSTLLETNKPYIMNVMRTPAMQTLFLYASTLETNNDFTRILCDQWLEITFENSEIAQNIISSLLLLRNARDLLLQLTLQGKIKRILFCLFKLKIFYL